MKTKKLFVQNISAFLVGFNPPAGVDKILKMSAETIDVNCTYIDWKRDSRRRGSLAVLAELKKKARGNFTGSRRNSHCLKT